MQIWHERLAHQNKRHVKQFLNVCGIKTFDDEIYCDGCAYGKQHRLPFGNRERAEKPREIIHSDLCGPMSTESIGKSKYFATFKDDFSGFCKIYFLQQKSELFDKLKLFCNEVKTQFGANIKELRSDGGKEYVNSFVNNFLGEQGIKHTVCVPYSPEQNGCAERANRTIVEAVRSMLHSNKDMPMSLWAEAANCAIFVLNMTGPSRINSKTPYELWYDKDIKLPDLKVFGTECFSHIPKQKRQKLDKKSVKGFVVGYDEMGYRIYVPERKNVIVSRDVNFKPEKTCQISTEFCFEKEASVELLNDECVAETEDAPIENEEFFDAQHNESDASPHTNTEPRYLLRDRSVNRQPIRYGIPQAHSFIARSVPNNYRDAVNSRESNEWRAAMREEMDSLTKNKTWILTEKPHNKKPIDCRWVFRIKEHADGTLERRKARLVIKGFAQKEGIDYTETFSPVARFETIRTIISIAAKNNLSLSQFDIKTAFLNGTVKEEIYMKQPEGFSDGSDRVCKLLKSLYGLKQAPRCWTEVFKKFLISFGLRESTADSCLYYNPNDEFIFIIVFWVDDGLVATSSEEAQSEFFSRLRDSFEFTMTQKVEYYLGIEIKIINEKGIFINQAKYIREMLEKFNMKNCNAVATPIVSGWESNQNINSDEALQGNYREVVGSLMYLQVVSRPDIAFAVNVASRALENPTNKHWQLVKRILRYLKGTVDLGLFYENTNDFVTYCDSDWAGDKETRKSTSGLICML
uniref:Integrase catalytic domain-containing protein n=1 Tax=Trichogramma kaykai TaxID=54128 RepID=A0ABD2WMS0_9HYME